MKGLTTGAEARHSDYCPNCRTTGTHTVINVTAELALILCERCGVPHAGEARAPTAGPVPPRAGDDDAARRWRWHW